MAAPFTNPANRIGTGELVRAAQNCWQALLPSMGVSAEFLIDRHGPCPGCGGRDRFRFDDREGRGTFVCGQGGETLTGDGFDLLRHVHGWAQSEAFKAVSEYLGMSANLPPRQRPQQPAQTARTATPQRTTGDYARQLWAKVNREGEVVAAHPYAVKKSITWAAGAGRGLATGKVIGTNADCLLIPARDIRTDEVVAVQCISAEGAKQTFGPVRGHAFVCGNTLDRGIPWFVCEGWADAASLVFHAHGGNAVAFACLGHHFDLVAQTVADHYAPRRLVIMEDAPND